MATIDYPVMAAGPKASTLAKPRSLEEELVPSEALPQKQAGENLATLESSFGQMQNTAGKIIGYGQAFNDAALKDQAFNHAFEMLGYNAPRGRVGELAKQQFEHLKMRRDTELHGKRAGLWEAVERGALLNVTDVTDIEASELSAIAAMAKKAGPDRLPEILTMQFLEDQSPQGAADRAQYEQYLNEGVPAEVPGFMKPLHYAITPSRMMQSGQAAATEKFREQGAGEAPPPTTGEKVLGHVRGALPGSFLGQPVPERVAQILKSNAMKAAGPVLEQLQQPTSAIRAVGEQVSKAGEAISPHPLAGAMMSIISPAGVALQAPGAALKAVGEAYQATPRGASVAGVPTEKAAEITADPGQSAQQMLAYGKGMVEGAFPQGIAEGFSLENHDRLTRTLTKIKEELGPDAVEGDIAAIALKDPFITQMAYEMGTDPFNFVGGAIFKGAVRGLGFLGRHATKLPLVGGAVEKAGAAAGGVRKAFDWFPQSTAMKKAGHEDAALMMELAKSEADQPLREAAKLAPLQQKIEKATKPGFFQRLFGKETGDKELLQAALDGRLYKEAGRAGYDDMLKQFGDSPDFDVIMQSSRDPAERAKIQVAATRAMLPEHLRPAFDASRTLSKSTRAIGIEAHTLQRFEQPKTKVRGEKGTMEVAEGPMELTTAPEKLFHVPHRVMAPEKVIPPGEPGWKPTHEQQARWDTVPTETVKQLQQRAALKRTMPDEAFVQDPALQHKKGLQDLGKRAPAATEMLKTHEYLGSKKKYHLEAPKDVTKEGYVLRIPRKLKKVKRDKMMSDLEIQTGLEWKPMSEGLRDAWLKTTGEQGLKFGKHDVVAPTHMVETLEPLAPLINRNAAGAHKAYQHIETFMDYLVRPAMSLFRAGTTVASGVPAYFLLQGVGALGLGTLAHKFRVLSPGIQKPAIFGALASAGMGGKWAKSQKFMLPGSGKSMEVGELLHIAERTGMLDQQDIRAGLDMIMGRGITGKVIQKISDIQSPIGIPIPLGKPWKAKSYQKTSGRNISRLLENYQKLITFAGFLEDTTPIAIARAVSLTAKFAGDLRRLAPIEKRFLRDIVAFYSWNRFAMPHMAAQMFENPQVVNKFIQGRTAAWRANDREIPEQAISPYLKLAGVPSPKSFQDRLPKIPGLGATHFSMLSVEDLVTLGGGLIPILRSLGGEAGNLTLADQTSPYFQFISEVFTGRDFRTGETLDGSLLNAGKLLAQFDKAGLLQGIAESQRTALGKLLAAPVSRPSSGYIDLYRLYMIEANKPAEAADLALRHRVGNNYWIFSKVFNILAEKFHGHEIPGAITTGWPGVKEYPIDLLKEAARASGKATKSGRTAERQLSK